MAIHKDRLPKHRTGILVMVKAWLIVVTANLHKRGVPESVLQTLTALAAASESALSEAKNESTRAPWPRPGARRRSTCCLPRYGTLSVATSLFITAITLPPVLKPVNGSVIYRGEYYE
jgi:hypothetical protein